MAGNGSRSPRSGSAGFTLRLRPTRRPRSARDGRGVSGSFAEFTPLGPIASSLRALPKRLGRAAVDPHGATVYAADDHDLYVIDPTNGTATQMQQDPRLLIVGTVGGLTFDTRRRRLLVLGYNGPGGGLYAYDPANGGWSVVGYIRAFAAAVADLRAGGRLTLCVERALRGRPRDDQPA